MTRHILAILFFIPLIATAQTRPVQFDLREATRIHDSLWSCVKTRSVNTALRHIVEARTEQVRLCEDELALCRTAVDVLDSAVAGAILERDVRVKAAEDKAKKSDRKASRAKEWSVAGWSVAVVTMGLLIITNAQ